MILVYKDDDSDMKNLLFSTAYGQKTTAIYKVLFIVFITFISVLLFMGIDYIMHLLFYGYCPQNVAIQSIPCLYESPYVYTILQWFIIFSIRFAFVMSMLSIFFSMLYQLCASKLISILLFILVLLMEAVCYFLIDETSIFAILTRINILRFIIVVSLYLCMPLQHFFELSISSGNLLLFVTVTLGVLSFIIYVFIYGKQMWNIKMSIRNITFTSTSLFLQENYMLLWRNKGILAILIVFIYSGFTFYHNYTATTSLSKHQKEVYQVYEPYLGNLNKSKVKALENTVEKYQHIDEDFDSLKNQYQENEITYQQYKQQEAELQKKE